MEKTNELIRKRRSVRTFDGKPLSEEDIAKIMDFAKAVENPFGLPVEFRLLQGKEHGLSCPVVVGTDLYLGAKMKRVPAFEEAYGYSFEKLILMIESLNIGTVWVGGTMNRDAFEKAIELTDDEVMPCMTPLGYTASQMSLKEKMMRKGVKADKRIDASKLFFWQDFSHALTAEQAAASEWNDVPAAADRMNAGIESTAATGSASSGGSILADALEAVRWAPSAVNKQPCRLVIDENRVHFYEKQDKGYVKHATGDLQRIDIGIAMYHFEAVMKEAGKSVVWKKEDPQISLPENTFYIATAELA